MTRPAGWASRFVWLDARGPGDFASAFAAASSGRAEALLVEDNQWVTSYLPQIAELAAQHKLPAIAHADRLREGGRLAVLRGGEGPPLQRAAYVDRILKGAKPADLPVVKPTTLRVHDQPEGREGPWPHDPAVGAGASGRGHPSMRTVGGVKRRSLVVPFFDRVEFTSSVSRQASTSHPFAHADA